MRLIQRVTGHPGLQIVPRPALNLAYQQRPQIGCKRQLLGLHVIPALFGNLLTPLRRHGVVERLLQSAGAYEGFQRPRHFASLGRFVRFQACGWADELCADRGLSTLSYAAS